MIDETLMNDLKKVELDIFKEFIKVCDKLKIDYYLGGGCLIGTIRHGGFIPWDDDIDVVLLRKDYDYFVKNAQKYLPKNYFLQTYETDKNYQNCFAKIRNSNTTFIESSCKNIKMNHGIYIDIFPIDSYKKINKFKMVLLDYQLNKNYSLSIKYNLKNKLLLFVSNILYSRKSTYDICKLKDKMYTKECDSDKVIAYSGAWGEEKERHNANVYSGYIYKKFEGIKVKIPIGYDEILTDTYGDYMMLPPVEKRVSHHYNEVIDCNKSYKEYINKEDL